MKLYYNSPIFRKDALISKNAVSDKSTATSSEPIDNIFIISFLERIIQFDILDLLFVKRYSFLMPYDFLLMNYSFFVLKKN